MKIRSALIAAIAVIAIWPAIADAQHFKGGGGGGRAAAGSGGGGGGRAAIGGHVRGSSGAFHASRGANFHGAPRVSFNRGARQTRNRAAQRAQHRSALRTQDRARLRNAAHAQRLASPERARRLTKAQQARQLRAVRAAAQPRRFAARYNANRWRYYYGPARWAWNHGWYAGYVGWYGPLFWPFVYADIFNWAFWPWGYAPGYWYYAYDDFFDGIFYSDAGSYYADSGRPPARYARRGAPPMPDTNFAQAQDLCKQPTAGVTAWPIADIERTVQPNEEQRRLLAQLKDVSEQAAQKFAVACPAENDLAGTAPGRLATIIGRLQATEEVIATVKPALDDFYNSLTDEQKTRFDALGPKESSRMANRGRPRSTVGSAAANGQAEQCGNVSAGLTDLPMQQIELAVRPSEAQQEAFRQLQDATNKAVEHLKENCPRETMPPTPSARLDTMQANIRAMIEAAEMIKPALESFYGALDETQKTRFNKLDKKMASVE